MYVYTAWAVNAYNSPWTFIALRAGGLLINVSNSPWAISALFTWHHESDCTHSLLPSFIFNSKWSRSRASSKSANWRTDLQGKKQFQPLMPNSFLHEQNTTVNDKSTAGRFDPKVFVNCVQDKEWSERWLLIYKKVMMSYSVLNNMQWSDWMSCKRK